MALQRGVYRPRDAEHTVLHQVIAEHLEVFLRAVAEAGDGTGLPQFVEREFREFLTCGVFGHGVARFRCEGCAREAALPTVPERRRAAGSGPAAAIPTLFGVSLSQHCPDRTVGKNRGLSAATLPSLTG